MCCSLVQTLPARQKNSYTFTMLIKFSHFHNVLILCNVSCNGLLALFMTFKCVEFGGLLCSLALDCHHEGQVGQCRAGGRPRTPPRWSGTKCFLVHHTAWLETMGRVFGKRKAQRSFWKRPVKTSRNRCRKWNLCRGGKSLMDGRGEKSGRRSGSPGGTDYPLGHKRLTERGLSGESL